MRLGLAHLSGALADRQHAGQFAMQVGVQPGPGRGGRQDDAVDHDAHHLHRLGAVLADSESSLQRLHLAAVEVRQLGVQQDRRQVGVGLLGCGEQLRFVRFQAGQALLHRLVIQPVLDRLEDAGDLALDSRQLALARAAVGFAVGRCRFDAGTEAVHELLNQFRRQQALLQTREDPPFDVEAADGAIVAAGALVPVTGAAIAVLGHDGVTAAAAPAGQQPRQQELAAVRPVQGVALVVPPHGEADRCLPGLHPLPQRGIDDA
ncbi:hypothetical protein VH563_31785 [Brevundimonas sp. HT1-5]